MSPIQEEQASDGTEEPEDDGDAPGSARPQPEAPVASQGKSRKHKRKAQGELATQSHGTASL